MRIRAFLALFLLMAPMAGSAYFRMNAQVIPAATAPADPALMKMRTEMLQAINAERAKKKLKALLEHPLLDTAAQRHVEDMVKRKFTSHKNPDGKNSEDRIRAAGYFTPPCICAVRFSSAENIGKGAKTVAQMMKMWMNSPVHRTHILQEEMQHMGLGYKGGIWVLNLGGKQILK